jgi:uncharacterized membrane protein SpoIIM required for sporulation
MRETDFIKKNRKKWKQYERALEHDQQDPELLRQLYIHTIDDLSYSRTYYPNRSVRVYLNGLAQRTFLQIYRGRRGETSRFFTFWTDELPRVVFARRRALGLALVVFVLAMLIGIISYRIDPAFAELIMGEYYMDMTRANIEGGDPMAVYKKTAPFQMSLAITMNNIMVAFLTFIAGAFFAVGTIVQLLRNGVMLGVFQYFFYDQGIFQESFLTIWIHGAIEISSIVIAGGAGLVMGSGLLFPGTLSRLQAFKSSARDGLKIMLGTVPLFVMAGFIEGYLTRHTELPDAIRLLFIILCFAFVLWYYVIYPRRVAARPPIEEMGAARRSVNTEGELPLKMIRTSGENLTDTVSILRRNIGTIMGGLALVTLVFIFFSFTFFNGESVNRYVFTSEFIIGDLVNVNELTSTFSRNRSISYLLLVAGGFYGLLRLSYSVFWKSTDFVILPASWRSELFLYLGCVGIALCFAFNGTVTGLAVFLLFPFLMTFAYAGYVGQATFRETFQFVYTNLVASYSNFLLVFLMAIPCIWLIDTTVGGLIFTFLDWVFYADNYAIDNLNVILQAFTYWFLFGLIVIIWGISFALNFYNLREIERADGLIESIERVGTKRRIRGMELE